ncbi:MAG TPA: hypothetical protein VFU36_11245, partial [Jatrophihabitans sp.]|nr:hypothetical protein [Jatrophihabitans sp.]
MTALSPDTDHPAGRPAAVVDQPAVEPMATRQPADPPSPEPGSSVPEPGSSVPEPDSSLPEYHVDRPIALHPLVFLDEGEEVTVGRLDADSYCVLPADGAALLRELERGVPPRQAADWYFGQYREQVDIIEFLAAMDELGFLARPEQPGQSVAEPPAVPWQRLGRLVFSPAAWLLYGVLLAVA